MRQPLLTLSICALLAFNYSAAAASGRVIKVLPHLLDAKGRHSLSPSLYERDAYQAYLRNNPDKCSALRFDVEWKAKDAGNLKLRVELRGIPKEERPNELTLEKTVKREGWLGQWSAVSLEGKEFVAFGKVIAWRATLWDGDKLLSEQKSFLW